MSSRADLDLGVVRLRALQSYREITERRRRGNEPQVAYPGAMLEFGSEAQSYLDTRPRSFAQEVRLLSPDRGAFRWSIGARMFHEHQRSTFMSSASKPMATSIEETIPSMVTASRAAFAEVGWNFNDWIRGTLGVRHTRESKSRSGEARITPEPTDLYNPWQLEWGDQRQHGSSGA